MKIKPGLTMGKIRALRPKGQILPEWPYAGMVMPYSVKWAKTFSMVAAQILSLLEMLLGFGGWKMRGFEGSMQLVQMWIKKTVVSVIAE